MTELKGRSTILERTSRPSPLNRHGTGRTSRSSLQKRISRRGVLFVMPTLILLSAFNLFPVLYTGYISLQHDNLLSPPSFVGLANFRTILSDPQFWAALRVTLEYTVIVGPISWTIAFCLALLLKSRPHFRRAFTALLFLPSMMPIVAMSVVWENLLEPDGPINRILHISVPWLSESNTAIVGIAFLGIWYSVGWFMVLFLAGLSMIPDELYEAGALDGATGGRMLRWLTLPLMRPIFAFVIVQTTFNGLQVFTPMYLMTGGGPANASTSISLYIYQEGLTDLNMGVAAAASVVGLLCVVILCALYLRVLSAERAQSRSVRVVTEVL